MYDYQIKGKRILELGCGIAMASLILNHRHANITATDYHPEVEPFLIFNTNLNLGPLIPFAHLDWNDHQSQLGKFDLIIGSDLLYERGHATALSQFIDFHAHPHCEVIIVDPGRGNQARFSKEMDRLSFVHAQNIPVDLTYLTATFKGLIHHYLR